MEELANLEAESVKLQENCTGSFKCAMITVTYDTIGFKSVLLR